jgi:predicted DNA-binding transcriptional regulator AlpA
MPEELTTPEQRDEILDIGQAAKLANKSVSTRYWLRQTGQGPRSGKLGRRLVYKRSHVLAWIESAFEGDAR